MEGQIKILRIIARLNVGGPARHVVLLDSGLRARGYSTRLVYGSLDEGEASLEHLALENAIPVLKVPDLGRRISLLGDVRALGRLIAATFRERPDIVHTHTAKAGTLGRISALVFNLAHRRQQRCVIVHTFHGHVLHGYFHPAVDRIIRFIERVLARGSDRIVAISQAQHFDLSERFAIASGQKIVTIPLGLQLDSLLTLDAGAPNRRGELAIPPDHIVFGFVGRLVPIKALPILLAAFRRALHHDPNLWLVLAGDGPLRHELEQVAASNGISHRVRFLGWTEDLPRLYATMDICVLASRNEGTPVAIIEAMAAGCAVVATRVGGVPDVVEDGVSGLLVEPGDVEALAMAMVRLAGDASLRQNVAATARDRVATRYTPERLIEDVERMYLSALAEKRDGLIAVPRGRS